MEATTFVIFATTLACAGFDYMHQSGWRSRGLREWLVSLPAVVADTYCGRWEHAPTCVSARDTSCGDQWRASLLLVRTRWHCPKDFPQWTDLIAHGSSGWSDKRAKLPSWTFRLGFILMLHRSTSLQGAPQSTLTNEHGAFRIVLKRGRENCWFRVTCFDWK